MSKAEICYYVSATPSKFPSETKQRVVVSGCSLEQEEEVCSRKAGVFARRPAAFTHAPLNPTQMFWVTLPMPLIVCSLGTFLQKDACSH